MKQNKLTVIHSFPIWLPQTQTWMYNQAKYLPENIAVHIVCERTENLGQFALPNIHSLKDESGLQFYWQKGLRKLGIRNHLDFIVSTARKIQADLIHSHFGYVGWANLEPVRQTGMRHVVTFYGEDVNHFPLHDPRWRYRYQSLFEQADLFLCEGPHMAMCLEKLGCAVEKISVHHLGVTVEEILYRPRDWHPGEPLRVLIASSFREKKGIPYALQALAMIRSGVELEITLLGDATGDESSQNEKQRILDILEKSGLAGRTRMLGFQPYSVLMKEAYGHHLFLLPSVTAEDGDTEGGAPVVLIEMMATGMPVVSTTHCDIPSVVQYGMADWLVPERDSHSLANRIQWLLDHPIEWRHLLDLGRRHVEVNYDAIQQGRRLGNMYQEVLSQKKSVLN